MTTDLAPFDEQVEQALLGAMILSTDAIGAALDAVARDDFYLDMHRKTYEVIIDQFTAGGTVDPLLVGKSLPDPMFVHRCMDRCTAVAAAPEYAAVVADLATRRRLIEAAHEIITRSRDADIVEAAQSLVYSAVRERRDSSVQTIGDITSEVLVNLEDATRGVTPNAVPTGFEELDRILGGMLPGQFIIVAARPGVGKSALSAQLARNVAFSGKSVGFFSLEMTGVEIGQRLISAEASVPSELMRDGRMDGEQWGAVTRAAEVINALPLTVDSTGAMTPADIRARCRRFDGNLGLVVVDYLQLMTHHEKTNTRNDELSGITRSLKLLAKELRVPIIACSQLNRDPARQKREPQLSDLRDSGAIEQDADIVLMLDRDLDDDSPTADLFIRKHRNGRTGKFQLDYEAEYTRFAKFTGRGTR